MSFSSIFICSDSGAGCVFFYDYYMFRQWGRLCLFLRFLYVPTVGPVVSFSTICICSDSGAGCVFFYDFYMFWQRGIFCFSFYYKTLISLTVFDFIFISIRSSYDLAWCCRYILVFYSSPIFDNYHWFSNLTI